MPIMKEVFVMITLAILLALVVLGALMLGTVGVGILVAFGDVLVAALIVYGIYKLFNRKKESKK